MAVTSTLMVDLEGLGPEQIEELRTAIANVLESFQDEHGDSSAVMGWTVQRAAALLLRLAAANRPVQAKVIHHAAKHGGTCDRETVYELGGYAENRSLKGFTRPINRIVNQMQSEGLLPTSAADPCRPIYDSSNPSYQKAQGFGMDPALVPVFAKALDLKA